MIANGSVHRDRGHRLLDDRVSWTTVRRPMIRQSKTSLIFVAFGLVLLGLYSVVPSTIRPVVYCLFGLSALIVFARVTRRAASTRRRVWRLIMIGLACFWIGDVIWATWLSVTGTEPPFPSLVDGFYLLAYPFFACGFFVLAAPRRHTDGGLAILQALTLAVGIGVTVWTFVIGGFFFGSDSTLMAEFTAASYPVADTLLLAFVVYTLRSRPSISMGLLSGGCLLLLLGDALYMVPAISGSYRLGTLLDATWLLSYVLWGAAVLHPSRDARVLAPPERRHSIGRATAVPLLIVPSTAALYSQFQGHTEMVILSLGWIVLVGVVTLSMRSLTHTLKQELEHVESSADELRRLHDFLLLSLAKAGEFRDDETGRHTERVADLAYRIAKVRGWGEQAASTMKKVAPLHDIGKMGLPDSLLLKAGPLSDEEFAFMKTHTIVGSRLLSGWDHPLLASAKNIARSHHEWWDGSGYPDGLRGVAIPQEARIVAVADVFDALTTARPYKRAWSVEEAISQIKAESGTHFDPEVVQDFLFLMEPGPKTEVESLTGAPGTGQPSVGRQGIET